MDTTTHDESRDLTDAAGRKQFLSFTLAGSECAVPILKVREILQFDAITRIPSTPPSIRGVIDLRGSIVPVVDLARKFGIGETAVTKAACILIVDVAFDGIPTTMGVLADTVREVIDPPPDGISSPPAFGPGIRVDYITGMAKTGNGLVLLLDLDRVISVEDARAAADAIAAASDVAPGVAGEDEYVTKAIDGREPLAKARGCLGQ